MGEDIFVCTRSQQKELWETRVYKLKYHLMWARGNTAHAAHTRTKVSGGERRDVWREREREGLRTLHLLPCLALAFGIVLLLLLLLLSDYFFTLSPALLRLSSRLDYRGALNVFYSGSQALHMNTVTEEEKKERDAMCFTMFDSLLGGQTFNKASALTKTKKNCSFYLVSLLLPT